jgi:type II secretory pathway pseudopilin PulG
MQRKNYAFSFVEAILTVAVIAILAAVILPRFIKGNFIRRSALGTVASGITADIRYTRRLAVTNADHYLIKFDFNLKEYRIYKDSLSPANQIGQVKKIPAELSLAGTEQFDFYSLGNAEFSGNGLDISTDGTHQYKITVEPPSGAVSVEKIS